MGQYGGTTTVMSALPVGTSFYVCNGAWDGMITEKDGVKHLKIIGGKEFPLTGERASHTLDINILESTYEITYEQTSVRVMTVKAKSLEEAMEKYKDFDCVRDREDYGISERFMDMRQVK